MKILPTIYVIIIVNLTIIIGCKKEAEPIPERQIPEYKLPDDFLRYFAFKPGSYWVYKNKLNGLYDTVTVTSYKFGYHTVISGNSGKALYKYEDFVGSMTSSYYQAIYNYNSLTGNVDIDKNETGICFGLEMDNSGPWGNGSNAYILYYPLVSNDTSNSFWGKVVRIINSNDTFTYKSSILDHIIALKMNECRFFYESPGIIKVKKDIGVVYKENPITNNDTWFLIDYKTYY